MSRVTKLVPEALSVSARDAEMLLELVYLVTAADHRLAEEELAAFAALAARLRGKASLDSDVVDLLMDRYAQRLYANDNRVERRVLELATSLPRELHELAYKLALGVAFVDSKLAHEEDTLHRVLADALGISSERREAIESEVSLVPDRTW